MLARIDGAIQRLLTGELHGQEARLLDGRRVLGWPVPPYRIYFERTASSMRIVRVYHQARRPIE
jgi:plasmid stabilization system protein ParE